MGDIVLKSIAVVGAAAALIAGSAAIPATAGGMPTAKGYSSCKSMNNGKYPHGVGKKGAVDRTSGKRVTNFTRSNKVYWLYSSSAGSRIRDLDRDNDGIACEKP